MGSPLNLKLILAALSLLVSCQKDSKDLRTDSSSISGGEATGVKCEDQGCEVIKRIVSPTPTPVVIKPKEPEDDLEMKKIVSQFNLGIEKYGKYCASCHLPIDQSQKRNTTAEAITAAIANDNNMKFLKDLVSSIDAEDIALALNDAIKQKIEIYLKTPKITPLSLTNFQTSLANRWLLNSKLKYIFLSPYSADSTEDVEINKIINKLVRDKAEAFGGACRRYDTGCIGDLDTNRNAKLTPNSSALRLGYMTRVCEEVLSLDTSITKALAKISLDQSATINTTNVEKLASLFFAAKKVPASAIESLVLIGQKSQAEGQTDFDRWRFLMLPMCKSTLFSQL